MADRPYLAPCGSRGADLKRPECALAHTSGLVFAPCWHGLGGVSVMRGNHTRHVLARSTIDELGGEALRPNGIALTAQGELLMAHLGDTRGAIVSLSPDGEPRMVVDQVDGEPMPPANFVTTDNDGRLWITVSTRLTPRALDYRKSAATGFIAVAEPGERNARIIADGLGYTNECVIDAAAGRVYVNETFARRLTAFNLHADAHLSDQRVLARFGAGTYPDGLAADIDGGLWVTSIVSNRVLHVNPDGEVEIVFADSDSDHIDWAEAAWEDDTLGRPHLDKAAGKTLRNVSNLAFGGSDLRDVFLGNLLGDTLPVFRSSVAGAEPEHWRSPITQWLDRLDADQPDSL